MKHRQQGLLWPLRCLPRIIAHQSGTFPMIMPGCNQTYWHPTLALHLHDYEGDFWIGRHAFRLEPGDITLSPPELPSRYALPASGSHLCIHFFPEKGDSACDLPLHLRLGPQTATARERFWRVIDHARQSGGKNNSPSAAAASAALQELLLWLRLHVRRVRTPRKNSLAETALGKLRATLEASIAKPVSVADLAAGAGLSSEYLARLFVRRYGMTLQHYLLQRRMEVARHLLSASDLLVSEIGRRVGLPDAQYFNKQFRSVVGESPLAYRQQREKKYTVKPGYNGRKTASTESRKASFQRGLSWRR